jgi:hypothetical protein
MKPLFLAIVSLLVLQSCNKEFTISQPNREATFLQSNIAKTNSLYSIDLKYDGNKAIITRMKFKNEPNPAISYSTLYYETENVKLDKDNIFRLIDPSRKVWFVPFFIGTKPIPIGSTTECLKYYCNCGESPSPEEEGSPCSINATATKIGCDTQSGESCPNDRRCTGSAARVFCDELHPDPNIYYEMFDGGVIIEADEVEVSDPNLTSSKKTSMIFRVTSDGLVSEDDYKKEQAKKSN